MTVPRLICLHVLRFPSLANCRLFPELKLVHFLFLFPRTITKAELDEDSSYDSDTEAVASPHQNVSRNVSETLAQELIEEFNSVSFCIFRHHHRPIPDLKLIEIVVVSYFFFFLRALCASSMSLFYSPSRRAAELQTISRVCTEAGLLGASRPARPGSAGKSHEQRALGSAD